MRGRETPSNFADRVACASRSMRSPSSAVRDYEPNLAKVARRGQVVAKGIEWRESEARGGVRRLARGKTKSRAKHQRERLFGTHLRSRRAILIMVLSCNVLQTLCNTAYWKNIACSGDPNPIFDQHSQTSWEDHKNVNDSLQINELRVLGTTTVHGVNFWPGTSSLTPKHDNKNKASEVQVANRPGTHIIMRHQERAENTNTNLKEKKEIQRGHKN